MICGCFCHFTVINVGRDCVYDYSYLSECATARDSFKAQCHIYIYYDNYYYIFYHIYWYIYIYQSRVISWILVLNHYYYDPCIEYIMELSYYFPFQCAENTSLKTNTYFIGSTRMTRALELCQHMPIRKSARRNFRMFC